MGTAIQTLTAKLSDLFGMGSTDSNELIIVLKATAFKGQVTDAQMTALLIVANQYKLNPFTKEIYAFPDKNNGIVPVVGVDGWSRIINEHPQFDGVEFRQSETMVKMKGCEIAAPEWMECVLYRKDRKHPTVIREYLDEVYRPPFDKKRDNGSTYTIDGPWQTHPKRFLRHKCLIQCSRIAFGFVGIYDQDEAERIIDSNVIDGQIKEVATPTKPATQTLPDYTEANFLAGKEPMIKMFKAKKKTFDQAIMTLKSQFVVSDEYKKKIEDLYNEATAIQESKQETEPATKADPVNVTNEHDDFIGELNAADKDS